MVEEQDQKDLQESFATVWEAHHTIIERFIAKRLGRNIAMAEDLTSDVFLRAWTAWDRFDGKGQTYRVRAWLLQCASNRLTDHWRSPVNGNLSIDVLPDSFNENALPLSEKLEDEKMDEDRIALMMDRTAQVKRAIRRTDLALLLSIYWQGHTMAEAAYSVGYPAGGSEENAHVWARVQLFRFRKRLRNAAAAA